MRKAFLFVGHCVLLCIGADKKVVLKQKKYILLTLLLSWMLISVRCWISLRSLPSLNTFSYVIKFHMKAVSLGYLLLHPGFYCTSCSLFPSLICCSLCFSVSICSCASNSFTLWFFSSERARAASVICSLDNIMWFVTILYVLYLIFCIERVTFNSIYTNRTIHRDNNLKVYMHARRTETIPVRNKCRAWSKVQDFKYIGRGKADMSLGHGCYLCLWWCCGAVWQPQT